MPLDHRYSDQVYYEQKFITTFNIQYFYFLVKSKNTPKFKDCKTLKFYYFTIILKFGSYLHSMKQYL